MSSVCRKSQKHEARKYVGISWNSNLKLPCENNCDLGGALLKFFGYLPQRALKSGLFRQKSGGLFKFGCSGGLIKSGVL